MFFQNLSLVLYHNSKKGRKFLLFSFLNYLDDFIKYFLMMQNFNLLNW